MKSFLQEITSSGNIDIHDLAFPIATARVCLRNYDHGSRFVVFCGGLAHGNRTEDTLKDTGEKIIIWIYQQPHQNRNKTQ